jgi:iron complex outermembrane receptor protein
MPARCASPTAPRRSTNACGAFLPDISQGGTLPIGENDFEQIRTVGVGGSLQATETADLRPRRTISWRRQHRQRHHRFPLERRTRDDQSRNSRCPIPACSSTRRRTRRWTATPVSLNATNRYYGFFATDTFDVTDALSVTASGRYNVAEVDLVDRLGSALTGNNRYSRFNPALGAPTS